MNISLKIKIILLYSVFAILIVVSMSYYSYESTLDLLKSKEQSIIEDSMINVSKQIESKLKDMNERYINIFNENGFQNLVSQTMKGELTQASKSLLTYNFMEYFSNITSKNKDILDTIMLIDSRRRLYLNTYAPIFSFREFVNMGFFAKVERNKNLILLMNQPESRDYVAIARGFYFYEEEGGLSPGYKSTDMGDYSILVFLLRKSYFESLFNNIAGKRHTMIILLDENGSEVVKAGDFFNSPDRGYRSFLPDQFLTGKGSYEISDRGCNLTISYNSIKPYGWKVIYIYDQNLLYKDAGRVREIVLPLLIASGLLIILISTFISSSVVKPINELSALMDIAVEKKLEVSYRARYNDEISHLGHTFNKMIKQINELILRIQKEEKIKRRMELRALQAQINPHFLYNTLDTIYWMAKVEKQDLLAKLIVGLADFFRLSLNDGEDITTVEREIEHAKRYLEILKLRTDGKFDYRLRVDGGLLDKYVPKLILQPLIENSIIHGFNGIPYMGMITISVGERERIICFEIEDNGIGIKKEEIERLLSYGEGGTDKLGYAMGNVDERIRLYGGKNFGLDVRSGNGQGTKITITFPLDFDKNGVMGWE